MKRQIVHIDEDLCNGCGECVPSCHEGAIQIINGKAKLVSDKYCDGLGACLGHCPMNAITIEEREAAGFDEKAVKERMEKMSHQHEGHQCPGSMMKVMKKDTPKASARIESQLEQWPVQLMLLNVQAPYFEDADLLLVADCAPFAYANFHADFLPGKAIAVGCPKLDDAEHYVEKMTEILKLNNIKSLTVVNMEVPCCFGLVQIANAALKASGKKVPLKTVTIKLDGGLKI